MNLDKQIQRLLCYRYTIPQKATQHGRRANRIGNPRPVKCGPALARRA